MAVHSGMELATFAFHSEGGWSVDGFPAREPDPGAAQRSSAFHLLLDTARGEDLRRAFVLFRRRLLRGYAARVIRFARV